MAQTVTPTERAVGELERQRQRLEENVEKLSKSLKYWQIWEAEYEGFREELQMLDDGATSSALEQAGEQSTGELLNQKEINLLLRDDKSQPRTRVQVIGLLSRRIDYVQSNVKSLRGTLEAAEDRLTASEALNPSQHHDEEGYPLMEIQEELDEDENVISSTMTPASDAAPQIVEALRKAGLNGLPTSTQDQPPQGTSEADADNVSAPNAAESAPPILKQGNHEPSKPDLSRQTSPSTSESDTRGDDSKIARRRKSVTFADGTKQAPPVEARPAKDVQAAKARNTARRIKAEVRGSIDALKKVHNAGFIDEQVFDRFRKEYLERLQDTSSSVPSQSTAKRQVRSSKQQTLTSKTPAAEELKPIIPNNETPEDAALRRDMIRYNMNEVGAVVAEMNLDDEESDPSSTGESTEEGDCRNSSDDDEDEWGMSHSHVLNNDYMKDMQALEQKLNAKSIQNVGPHAAIETLLQAENELVVGEDGNPVQKRPEATNTTQGKKAVRFAKALDIQESRASPANVNGKRDQPKEKNASAPINGDIIERSSAANGSNSIAAPASKRKVSQFKSSKLAAAYNNPSPLQIKASNEGQVKTPSLPAFTPPATPKMTPTGSLGRSHAPSLVERPYTDDMDVANVAEPDEFDEPLVQQELKMDYHRTRNRMIQRQGGFLGRGEEEDGIEGPLVDENGRKISKFKAARLRAPDG